MGYLTDFINSILIIDDKDEEVEKLKQFLQNEDFYVKHFHPEKLLACAKIHRKDLVFLDFMLDDEDTFKTILSKYIRPIFKKHFHDKFPYGIVIWTKHEEYVEDFYEKLKKDTLQDKKYTAPVFIISLDKNKYLTADDFSTVVDDINLKLTNSFSANFFINWNSRINTAIYSSISDIFHLTNNYDTQEPDVKRIIYKLAENEVGVSNSKLPEYQENGSLSNDAYKAFDDLLYSNLTYQNEPTTNLFADYKLPSEAYEQKIKDAASLNFKLFFDIRNLDENTVVPGNIYKIVKKDKFLCCEDSDNDIIPIALEITPPCDFSQDKKNSSKLIGGFIKEITIQNEKTIQSLWKKNKNKYHYDYDFRYFLWPIKIPEYNNYCFICFDFHFEETLFDDTLLSKNNFELLFRTKKSLFADILQKYSSNKARLGTSFFNLK